MVFKRKAISFNLDCPNQKELYEHCANHPNFSGYVKSVLFHYLHSQNNNFSQIPEQPIIVEEIHTNNDMSLVADLL
ncbi:hypothetical protein H1D32_13485 [Anaerobacillus sp. CMMVII]|uniref:hypothetical protein n=1 Tax=Anaerobacillus sp. CMMVII TaxID=2755588 RepID=UPI0021B7155E|nr:hypothetical protein [Anaerobacillus sp. CMMVII]MCT8138667.1 hypothetical protein [Anaerobacillus sp. CMMVII]